MPDTPAAGAARRPRRVVMCLGRRSRLALLLTPLFLFAEASLAGADGAALFAGCAACHGSDARGNAALGAPALAGQLPVYLERQLHMFRRDIRGTAEGDSYGAQMRPFAAQLPDTESIAILATWLGSLAPASPAQTWEGDARRGASLYNGNCGACHGGRAEGNEALKAPRLAGLDPAYLERQVRHFQSGVRGGNPRDRLGRQMATMAATLTGPDDLDDILAYIAGLGSVDDAAGEDGAPP